MIIPHDSINTLKSQNNPHNPSTHRQVKTILAITQHSVKSEQSQLLQKYCQDNPHNHSHCKVKTILIITPHTAKSRQSSSSLHTLSSQDNPHNHSTHYQVKTILIIILHALKSRQSSSSFYTLSSQDNPHHHSTHCQVKTILIQAWELRMEKSSEKWGPWGPQKFPSGGPGGNAPGGGQRAKPPEAF